MQSLDALIRDFQKSRAAMDALMKKTPDIIGVESVKIVKQNFLLSGYDSGNGVTPWPKRKNATNKAYTANRGKGGNSNYKGSVYSASKPLLRQSLALFNSIKFIVSSGYVFIGVDLGIVPYAQVHNEGGTIHQKERTAVLHFDKNKKFSTAKKANYAQKNTIAEHSWSMPKRQYLPTKSQGANPKMINAIKRKLDFETKKAMKAFSK
jgi:hypothetical protein